MKLKTYTRRKPTDTWSKGINAQLTPKKCIDKGHSQREKKKGMEEMYQTTNVAADFENPSNTRSMGYSLPTREVSHTFSCNVR